MHLFVSHLSHKNRHLAAEMSTAPYNAALPSSYGMDLEHCSPKENV